MKKIIFLFVLLLIGGISKAAGVVSIANKDFYTAAVLSCHFPIPVNYEYSTYKNESLLFVKDDSGIKKEEEFEYGKIEVIKNYDNKSDNTERLLKISKLIKYGDVELNKAFSGKNFIYFIDRGSERIFIVDKEIDENATIAMVKYCYEHPIKE